MSYDQLDDDLRAFESRLAAQLPELVRGVRAPAGLPDQVRTRVSRRRARHQLAAAVSTVSAVAAAAAVLLASGPAPRPAVSPPVITIAEVIARAQAATADMSRLIKVTKDGAGVSYLDASHHSESWYSARRISGGQPLMASGESITGTTWTSILVDYKDRVYATTSASTLTSGPWGAKGISVGASWPYGTASDPEAAYLDALRHGSIKLIGYRYLDGRRTILIQLVQHEPRQVRPKLHPIAPDGRKIDFRKIKMCPWAPYPPTVYRVWLDASSYLEAQYADIEPRFVGGSPAGPGQRQTCARLDGTTTLITATSWLPPNKKNTAVAKLVPPAGFTQVSEQQIAVYLGPYS